MAELKEGVKADTLHVSAEVNTGSEKLHSHDVLEIIYVISGTADLLISTTSYHIETGDMRIINYKNIHKIMPISADFRCISLFLDVDFFRKYIPDIDTVYFEANPDKGLGGKYDNYFTALSAIYWSIIHDLISYQSSKSSYYQKKVTEKSTLLLLDLRNWFTLMYERLSLSSKNVERMWRIIDYIYDNYDRKLTLEEIAGHVHVTPNYLSHYVKDISGMSFQDVLSFIRSEAALEMLISTDKSISEISFQCGFSELKYFKKYFKKFYKISPAEYRKLYAQTSTLSDKHVFHSFDIHSLDAATAKLISNAIEKNTAGTEFYPNSEKHITIDFDFAAGNRTKASSKNPKRVQQAAFSYDDMSIYSPSGIKTPQYYMEHFTALLGELLYTDGRYFALCGNASNWQLLIFNNSSEDFDTSTLSADINLTGLLSSYKTPRDCRITSYTLYGNEYSDTIGEYEQLARHMPVGQRALFADVYAPDIEHTKTGQDGTCEKHIPLPGGAAVLITGILL